MNTLQREQVLTISRSAGKLLNIIDDILDMSKVEAGELVLETLPFDLHETLENVVTLLAPAAAEKRVEVLLQYDVATPRTIYGDPLRVRQVVTNLVGNAVKFTDQGQIVVDATVDGRTGAIRVSVEDSGIGIASDKLEEIFSPFTQADSSTTRRFGGSGLGLSISREMARLMGGDVHVASTPGEGSTFTFLLRPPMFEHESAHDYDLGGASVLVISKRSALVTGIGNVIARGGGVMRHLAAAEMAEDELASLAAAGQLPTWVVLDAGWGDRPFDWLVGDARRGVDDAPLRLIALLPPGDILTGHRLVRAGFDSWIGRPVRERTLLAALTGQTVELPMPARPTVTVPFARVLVAEDDPTCTAVAVMMLERMGCETHTVSTGDEAVQAAITSPFDLILMDCLMPGVDGYAATEQIRANVDRRIPIIALTAAASSQDRQRALDAGMDDHLAKPFDLPQLRETVARWAHADGSPPGDGGAPHNHSLPHTPAPAVFDYERAIERLGGNKEVVQEILEIFLDSWSDLRAQLDAASRAHDAHGLHMVAHRVKSSAGNLGADRLRMAAENAEADWFEDRLDASTIHLETLVDEFERFRSEAERFRAGGTSS